MPEPMTPEQRAEIRARAEAATPGPWHGGVSSAYITSDDWTIRGKVCQFVDGRIRNPNADNDYAFIAHARTDVPALLDEVERLEASLKSAEAVVEAARRQRAAADELMRARDFGGKTRATKAAYDQVEATAALWDALDELDGVPTKGLSPAAVGWAGEEVRDA